MSATTGPACDVTIMPSFLMQFIPKGQSLTKFCSKKLYIYIITKSMIQEKQKHHLTYYLLIIFNED